MHTPEFDNEPRPGTPSERVSPVSAYGLTITQASRDAAVVVQAAGEVDLSTHDILAQGIAEGLRTAATGHPRLAVIDLRAVRFFGSAGLAALVQGRRQAIDLSVDLRVVADGLSVLRIFRLTELDQVLAVHPTVEDALAAAES